MITCFQREIDRTCGNLIDLHSKFVQRPSTNCVRTGFKKASKKFVITCNKLHGVIRHSLLRGSFPNNVATRSCYNIVRSLVYQSCRITEVNKLMMQKNNLEYGHMTQQTDYGSKLATIRSQVCKT
jgi:hypothetical protein